ncbi:hypothetical protein [Reichenbachiella ulvae]|uniref:Uncharacterized protein n=1 Tax=Reichenbachiella ulvae TaxID=2980104 RepID=A0ABT3CYD2_9BACT|nr:hypothetical protein [Reichenbachiella ulvae]MCV9388534.1 hypothetical protein [Reichenbachiella ulvae]
MNQLSLNKIPLIIGLILFCGALNAQKLAKFKEVLPGILGSDPANAVAALKKYQQDDPEKASVYVQLSLVYYQRFADSDPLVGYKRAIANIKLAQEAQAMAKVYLNEKEVKRNEDEFLNFAYFDEKGRMQVELDSIYNRFFVDSVKMAEYQAHVPPIYEAFTGSYMAYSRANQVYTQIMGRYKTLKELYLLYDEDIAKEFESLKKEYLRALELFDSYQSLIEEYHIGYDQSMEIRDIEVYRLDGLSVEINFLQEKIPIWNYAKWVDEINGYVDKDIQYLRMLMVQNEKLLNTKLARTPEDYMNKDFELFKVSKELLFNIRKYDLNSVVEPLFEYKSVNQKLLVENLKQENQAIEASSKLNPIYNYGRMLYEIKRADTILNVASRRNTKESYERYQEFIDQFYQGIQGVNSFVNNERNKNQSAFNRYLELLKPEVLRDVMGDSLKKEYSYKRKKIKDYVQMPTEELLSTGQPITTQIVENIDGSQYLGGQVLDPQTGRVSAFVSRKEGNGRISWYQEINLSFEGESDLTDTEMTVLNDELSGCTFIVRSEHPETKDVKNTLLAFSDQGEQLFGKILEINKYPRTLNFVESLNSYVLVFYGDDREVIGQLGDLTVTRLTSEGDVKWQQSRKLNGNVFGLVSTEDGFILAGNYKQIANKDGSVVSSTSSLGSTYLLKVNHSGDWAKERFFSDESISNQMRKYGDHCIPILSIGDQPNINYIVTKDLDLVSSSFD